MKGTGYWNLSDTEYILLILNNECLKQLSV